MIAHLDCSTGVSGDKLLGAALDAAAASGAFTAEDLSAVVALLAPEARVEVREVRTHGIRALGVRVHAREEPAHRHWGDIRSLLGRAPLPDAVRDRSVAVFARLAAAEAHAHGVAEERVHFHEVGALDSIADVVGACAALHALGVERLIATPVALGSGTVETSHGVLPVPAPATARLLLGTPVYGGELPGELTTPTGAALLAEWADGYGPSPAMVPRAIGYGAGTRDIGHPNVCRLLLGEPDERSAGMHAEDVAILESNIDHLSPEALASAAEQLLAEGALDVWQSPIVMKKGRAAILLTVLTAAEEAERFAERMAVLTGTLGVRRTDLARRVAEREHRCMETPWGPVRFKIGAGRARPEHEDVARIARATGRPYGEVARELGDMA